ncbi:MAG: SRPBCC family protein [Alphaproteobacteria bacterium]|nr:SRPBCC family protein [Alphaproteobacteria bacterium]
MFKIMLTILAVAVIGFVMVVGMQPADFRISRTMTMSAPAPVVFEQVNDFHKWGAWSPWAKLDPNQKNTFEGPESGVGAVLRWEGNREVGVGSMTIIESRPSDLVRMKLEFLKPFAATDTAEFTFKAKGNQTEVTWSMYGKNDFIGKAMNLVMNCDKMVGGMFEKGLTNMKGTVEAPTKE